MPLLWGDVCLLTIRFHHEVEHTAGYRCVVSRQEESRGISFACPEHGFYQFNLIRLHHVGASDRALETVYSDLSPLKVDVVYLKQPDLACSKAIAVGKQENGTVSLMIADGL